LSEDGRTIRFAVGRDSDPVRKKRTGSESCPTKGPKTAKHYPSPPAPSRGQATFAGGLSWPYRTCNPWYSVLQRLLAPARPVWSARTCSRSWWAIRRGPHPHPYRGAYCPDCIPCRSVPNLSHAGEVIRRIHAADGPVGPRAMLVSARAKHPRTSNAGNARQTSAAFFPTAHAPGIDRVCIGRLDTVTARKRWLPRCPPSPCWCPRSVWSVRAAVVP
jgi:hypothetical protein